MGYRFDTDTWPVVLFEFTGRLSVDESDRYFADSDALIGRAKTYAAVMDGTTMLVPEAEFVRRQAAWLRAHNDELQRFNRGIAFVVRSTLIRGLVRAVMHFQAVPVPYEWFATVDEAMTWAAAQVAASP